MDDDVMVSIRDTLFRLFLESGLLRPVPVPMQVMEIVNGRSYRIVPLGMVWPSSCLYYASQDARLHHELLVGIYERKTVLDGGMHMRGNGQSPLAMPRMNDRGWLKSRERTAPPGFWDEEFRIAARPSSN